MSISLLTHRATDGSDLYAIVSISAIRSLTSSQVEALAKLGIRRVSELLHYRPIHDARLITSAGRGLISHEISVADLVDAAHRGRSARELSTEKLSVLVNIDFGAARVFRDAFGVTTIEQLARFGPFEEAQKFLTPADEVFREPASAPNELMPKMVGAVESTATYSSFVKEESLRLKGVELTYDDTRFHFVDPRLADLFPVRGLFRISSPFRSRPKAFPSIPEPELHLGYVCRHTQNWVNMGTFLGEVVYSLALAPGESRNIAVVDWTRSQRTRQSEDTTVSEQLTNDLFHVRALDEVTRSTAVEHQQGGTTIAAGTLATAAANVVGAAVAGGLAATVPGAAIGAVIGAVAGAPTGPGGIPTTLLGAAAGAVIGFGVGAAVAGGTALLGAGNAQLGILRSDSSGNRAIEGILRQNITETVSQKASALRSLRSNIFVTDKQAEHERLQTRNITNYNHSHMLNIEFFELLQHYRVELKLTEAEPLLFLPFRPLEFTFELIRDYWPTLRRGIVQRQLRQKFDRLIDGIESGTIASEPQQLKVVTVELHLTPAVLQGPVQVSLTGQPGVQQTRRVPVSSRGSSSIGLGLFDLAAGGFLADFAAGRAEFSFNDPRPAPGDLAGVSVTGLWDFQRVAISVLIETRDSSGRAFRHQVEDDSLTPANGIVNFTVNVGGQDVAGDVAELERYFNERRYFFTRLLLLAIEKEQLIDLVEALQFQSALSIRFPDIPSFDIGDRPTLGTFVSGQRRVADVALRRVTSVMEEQIRTAVTSRIGTRSNGTLVASVVERALDAVRGEIAASPPLDELSIAGASTRGVAAFKRALVSAAGLTEQQATAIARSAGLVKSLNDALKAAIKLPGILTQSVHLAEFIEPEPIAITGNTLVFRMKQVRNDEVLRNDLVKNRLRRIVEQPASVEQFVAAARREVMARDVHLPTTGVFAEAILGRANASEKIDLTRFFNWQDSPIPHLAPQIAALQAGSRAQEPLDTKPTVPSGVLNIVNPPAFPDPTGLAAVLAAIQNPNIFRDMSKSDQLVTVMSNLSSLAQSLAQQAGSLAGQAQAEALRSATEIGRQVAQLAAQSTSQPSNLPTTPTSQGAAANLLDQLRQTAPGIVDTLPADIKKVLGIQPSVAPTPDGEELLKSRGDVSELINEFARSGIGEMKLNTGGEGIELKRGTLGNTTTAGLFELGSKALPANIDDWREVFMHTVPSAVIQDLQARDFAIQGFDFAENVVEVFSAAINLDFYEVRISQKPRKADGTVYSPTELINDIRLNMSDLIDVLNLHRNPFAPSILVDRFGPMVFNIPTVVAFVSDTTLDPFDDNIDLPKWTSANPLGAVMQFNNKLDDMGVVLSTSDAAGWIFTTIRDGRLPFTGDVGTHPVSGNRRFGIRENSDGTVSVFTRGADRSTGVLETGPLGLVFLGGHVMWLSWQAGVVDFIEKRGGLAQIVKPFSERFNFNKVNQHFRGIPL